MRILVLSDLHCGATSGLTPPQFFHEELKIIQAPFWKWFNESVKKYGPFDALLGLGDMVDGEGKKGTLDTAITDVGKQAHAAALALGLSGIPNN